VVVGGDVIEEMWQRNSGSKKSGEIVQQPTSDGYGRLHVQNRNKWPHTIARYNISVFHLLSVVWHRYLNVPLTTPSLVYRCEALGTADWFHWQKQRPEGAIHSMLNVPASPGAGRIERRVYEDFYTRSNDEWSHIWTDFISLLPFKCIQVETWMQSGNIIGRNEASYREGDC